MIDAACALLIASVLGGLGPQTRIWGSDQNPEVSLEAGAQLSAEGAWEKTASRYDFAPGPRKEYDEETGLTYFGARYYDSKRARWISPDAAALEIAAGGNPIGLSTYAYTFHNPLNLVDPDGNAPCGSKAACMADFAERGRMRAISSTADVRAAGAREAQIQTFNSVYYNATTVEQIQYGIGEATGGNNLARAITGQNEYLDELPFEQRVELAILGSAQLASTAMSLRPSGAFTPRLKAGPGAASVDEFVTKVVNTKMGHAAERAVERAGFKTVKDARIALQKFGEEIEKSGVVPGGAVRDRANPNRWIVPGFGEGGAVAYQHRNGVLKLQTVLKWKPPTPPDPSP